nr:hypothetical protein [Tanacetum cinerariifolium]
MMAQQGPNQVEETLLVIVAEQLMVYMIVADEPLVLDEQLVLSMIADELVLHIVVVMEEMCRIVEQLVKAIGDIVMDCIEVDDCCSMTDDELTKKEVKQMEADDQEIQTILMGLPEDIYAAVDSCEIAREIWLRVEQIMKDSSIGVQKKKAKLFNECEIFTSIEGESIKLYYHCFSKLMNGITNQNVNQNGNGNVVAARAGVNGNGNNGNQIRCYNYRGLGHYARNGTIKPRRRDGDIEEIKEVNANCILMANLQQASTWGTQTEKALVYDSNGSAENDRNVISDVTSVEHNGGTIEQHPATVEETRAYFQSLYNNLTQEVENVNTVNLKIKETNADLTIELARYRCQ